MLPCTKSAPRTQSWLPLVDIALVAFGCSLIACHFGRSAKSTCSASCRDVLGSAGCEPLWIALSRPTDTKKSVQLSPSERTEDAALRCALPRTASRSEPTYSTATRARSHFSPKAAGIVRAANRVHSCASPAASQSSQRGAPETATLAAGIISSLRRTSSARPGGPSSEEARHGIRGPTRLSRDVLPRVRRHGAAHAALAQLLAVGQRERRPVRAARVPDPAAGAALRPADAPARARPLLRLHGGARDCEIRGGGRQIWDGAACAAGHRPLVQRAALLRPGAGSPPR